MKKITPQILEDLLGRGVEDVIVREELEKKLTSGKKLRIKLGIDPTNSSIHIGFSCFALVNITNLMLNITNDNSVA